MVAAALELIDEHGLAAFTVRALQEKLDVGAPTIYWHVGTKTDVLKAVVERVAESSSSQGPSEGTWQDRLRHFFARVRASLVAHPNVVELISSVHSKAFEHWMTEAVQIMEAATFADQEAADYARIALMVALAATQTEVGVRHVDYMELDPNDGPRRYRVKPELISPDILPTVALSTAYDLDQQHELIVELFISGLDVKRKEARQKRRAVRNTAT